MELCDLPIVVSSYVYGPSYGPCYYFLCPFCPSFFHLQTEFHKKIPISAKFQNSNQKNITPRKQSCMVSKNSANGQIFFMYELDSLKHAYLPILKMLHA